MESALWVFQAIMAVLCLLAGVVLAIVGDFDRAAFLLGLAVFNQVAAIDGRREASDDHP